MILKDTSPKVTLNTDSMGDLHEQEMANHQEQENHECKAECAPSVPEECTPSTTEDQTADANTKDSEIMIAADLNLYVSPMTILQNCKKTSPGLEELAEKSISIGGSGDMIAADLKKYGNPLDEK